MSIFKEVYDELNVEALTNLVDDISPYVRARGTTFPAVTFEIGTETFERVSTGISRSLAEVEVTCYARSVIESEEVGEVVKGLVLESDCNYLNSIDREYDEGYDDDSVGVFMVVINYTKSKEAE